jgi:hypothetical protein
VAGSGAGETSGEEPEPKPSRGELAIDAHVQAAGQGEAVNRLHPRPGRRSKAPAPLETVSVYRVADPEHWHLVSSGLSELHEKESPDSEWSGLGFELTFRIVSEDEPLWAVNLLANLANYVRTSGHDFAEGHLIDLRGPIRLGTDTGVTAAMIVEDPALAKMSGPFGWVQFLQVVGITADELELCRAWSADGVRDLLARDDPLLVTRLERRSLCEDPRWDEEITQGRQMEGSSLHELRIATLALKSRFRRRTVVEMGAGASTALGPALRRELVGVGASFAVVGDLFTARVTVSEDPGWGFDGEGLELRVPVGRVSDVAALFDGRTGWRRLDIWPGLWLRIVP